MAEKKQQSTLDKFFSFSKSHSEPPQRQEEFKEKLRREIHGDPDNNKYGKKYLEMPLDEKRKLYRCGSNFEEVKNLITWPMFWLVKKHEIKKQVRPSKVPTTAYPINESLNHKICLYQGDITRLEIDAIVNAANTSLLGGGGVDGAIHRSAGKGLLDECKTLNGCNTGDAKITSGHKLPAKYIIHTVGPFGKHEAYLKQCYERCLETALKFNVKTMAFPCISTGVYGYPQLDAAHVALRTVRNFLQDQSNADKIELIVFCVYLRQDWDIYTNLLQYYFPCEEVSVESKATEEKKYIEELEADVLNKDNIPDVCMDDILAMVDEEKQSSASTDVEVSADDASLPKLEEAGTEKDEDDKDLTMKQESSALEDQIEESDNKVDMEKKKAKVEESNQHLTESKEQEG